MRLGYQPTPKPKPMEREPTSNGRIHFLMGCVLLVGLAILGRIFQIQVLEHQTYEVLASDQHEVEKALIPNRGTVYIRDNKDGQLYAIAKDRPAWQVYAVPREIKQATTTAQNLSTLLSLPYEDVLKKIGNSSSGYALLSKDVPYETVQTVRESGWRGVGVSKGSTRWYPEEGIGGQFLGFVSTNDDNSRTGKYGVEGYYNDLLAGEPGHLLTEKDAVGRRIAIGTMELQKARDGSDLILTLDRNVQYRTCQEVERAVQENQAESGTIIVMDPKTGAILGMCSAPDFDSSTFNKVNDVGVFNNPATFYQYEPGSIFKPLTLAAGIEAGKVLPGTTYNDVGEEHIDDFTIRNSDRKAHGITTMNQVLEKSLNLGTIFVQRQLGKPLFREFVKKWGFGLKTNIELNSEAVGNISSLDRKGDVFAATASFGQGISVTPIQIINAVASIANGGKLMKPYIVQEIRNPDGSSVVTKPEEIRTIISPKTARLTTGMMVNVVENGHGKPARVPGYFVAGKTGTAQVPNPKGGYLQNATIGSFIGFAPSDDPRFIMLVKIDKPKDAQYAETVAAPVFGRMAKFLLSYYEIPPTRPINQKDLEEVNNLNATSTAGVAPASFDAIDLQGNSSSTKP